MLSPAVLNRVLLLVGLLLCLRVGFADDGKLNMDIEPVGGDLLEVTLTNTSGERLSVLKWDTPFEGVVSADLFTVYLTDGSAEKKLRYQGRVVKRAVAAHSDYLTLGAGESIQVVLPLSVYYDISIRGRYTVEYSGSFHVETTTSAKTRQITSSSKGSYINQHQTVSPEPVTLELTPALETRAVLPANFYSCSTQQQLELEVALQSSEDIALQAYEGLVGLQGDARLNSPRYKQWFGEFSSARYAKVLGTFEATADVLSNRVVEFDCSCADSGLYAYVFRNRPYRIYPCPNFWSSSLNGTDSRAGTIVHELTHFTSVSNTDDHQYGQIGVSSLAVSDPDLAVLNADSYEYFAENSPPLEISNSLEFIEIVIGNAESGQLTSGQSSFYKINGADYLELSSVGGDADLYVYESAALDQVVCRSLTQNNLDMCSHDPMVTAYIEVRGYTDSEYSLIAQLLDPDSLIVEQPPASDESQTQPGTESVAVAVQGSGSGGNSGEEPADDQGGGMMGWWLFLLIPCRYMVLTIPGRKCRVLQDI